MFSLLKQLERTDWILAAISLIFILVQVYLDLALPGYMSDITMLVQTEGSEMSQLLVAGGYMLLCAFGSLVASIIVGVMMARISTSIGFNLREALYDKVGTFSTAEINKFSTASLITRTTSDVSAVQMIITMGMQLLIKAPITAIWAISKIRDKHWHWSAATAIAVLILLLLIMVIFIIALPKTKLMQELKDKLTSVTRENLTGIRVVRAYSANDYQTDKFVKANNELMKTGFWVSRVMALIMPAMLLLLNVLSLVIYWIGAYLINDTDEIMRSVVFSDMIVFSSYAMQIIMAFMMMTMMISVLPEAMVSIKRIKEVLMTHNSILDGEGVTDSELHEGEIEFRNVSFKYPDAIESDLLLEDISFKVSKGETVAIIGATGSGKSTLVNLIPRLYDVTMGAVLVNGKDVREYNKTDLYNRIGYVSQKAVLFKGTIYDNVALGSNGKGAYTKADVIQAVGIAQGKSFVENLTDTYETSVTQGGTNLSGGQKQRLSIARAVCRKPDIYIFDDSFSALDFKTDKELRLELKKQSIGVTSIIVAQRIGTIMDAHKIIVIDGGKVVGNGTHVELMKTCEVYQEIAYSQLSEEELNHG